MRDSNKSRPVKLTPASIERATRSNTFREMGAIEYGQDVAGDPRRKHRLALQECRCCYYSGRVAGQAFTDFTCDNCEKAYQHSNTAVPRYCNGCARDHNACVRCGASLASEPEGGWRKALPTLADLRRKPEAYFWVQGHPFNRPIMARVNAGAIKGLGAQLNVQFFADGFPDPIWLSKLPDYPQLSGLQWHGPIAGAPRDAD